jgi:hypothetical protein
MLTLQPQHSVSLLRGHSLSKGSLLPPIHRSPHHGHHPGQKSPRADEIDGLMLMMSRMTDSQSQLCQRTRTPSRPPRCRQERSHHTLAQAKERAKTRAL